MEITIANYPKPCSNSIEQVAECVCLMPELGRETQRWDLQSKAEEE